ncbi:TPA: hypothetical protein N0F65_006937 [Lagenidium giganteum]|uniref:EF-hand domain-containing protein n=1 Tax=Lagenidium giganteum TaxID=4803 RepID=A0AAV2ZH50_9STRA|nr:TPA: hypothetical protein N0F65_006937 [Lagenidium giganteum]
MELVQSSFQTSFDARITKLKEEETLHLRTVFRFFDSNQTGAVSAAQACRIFRLLGLQVNEAQVHELGEVYMSGETNRTDLSPAELLEEAALARQHELLWEEEWRTLDTYRRGYITQEELRVFLRSCGMVFRPDDLDRLLELYVDPVHPSMQDVPILTKPSFLRFRRDYTARDLAPNDIADIQEDEEVSDGEDPAADTLVIVQEPQQASSDVASVLDTERTDDTLEAVSRPVVEHVPLERRISRRQSRMVEVPPSLVAVGNAGSSHDINVDPDELSGSDGNASEGEDAFDDDGDDGQYHGNSFDVPVDHFNDDEDDD